MFQLWGNQRNWEFKDMKLKKKQNPQILDTCLNANLYLINSLLRSDHFSRKGWRECQNHTSLLKPLILTQERRGREARPSRTFKGGQLFKGKGSHEEQTVILYGCWCRAEQLSHCFHVLLLYINDDLLKEKSFMRQTLAQQRALVEDHLWFGSSASALVLQKGPGCQAPTELGLEEACRLLLAGFLGSLASPEVLAADRSFYKGGLGRSQMLKIRIAKKQLPLHPQKNKAKKAF